MSSANIADSRLANAFGQTHVGDIFDELYRRYQKNVRGVIYEINGAHGLDDLVQDAFLKIWRSFGKFRNEADIKTWVYRISVNVALDSCRARQRNNGRTGPTFDETIHTRMSDDESQVNRDLVSKCLETLSDEHRATLSLAYFHDLSVEEISKVMTVSTGTVKSRLHYAKRCAKQFLEEEGVTL